MTPVRRVMPYNLKLGRRYRFEVEEAGGRRVYVFGEFAGHETKGSMHGVWFKTSLGRVLYARDEIRHILDVTGVLGRGTT